MPAKLRDLFRKRPAVHLGGEVDLELEQAKSKFSEQTSRFYLSFSPLALITDTRIQVVLGLFFVGQKHLLQNVLHKPSVRDCLFGVALFAPVNLSTNCDPPIR